MRVHELMLDRKKELVAARNATATYTYNLITAADQLIAEQKGSVLDVLRKKELLTSQDALPKPEQHDLDKVLEQEQGQHKVFRFKHLNQILPNDNLQRQRKTADGFFKRVLKTEGDERSESPFRMGQRRN